MAALYRVVLGSTDPSVRLSLLMLGEIGVSITEHPSKPGPTECRDRHYE